MSNTVLRTSGDFLYEKKNIVSLNNQMQSMISLVKVTLRWRWVILMPRWVIGRNGLDGRSNNAERSWAQQLEGYLRASYCGEDISEVILVCTKRHAGSLPGIEQVSFHSGSSFTNRYTSFYSLGSGGRSFDDLNLHQFWKSFWQCELGVYLKYSPNIGAQSHILHRGKISKDDIFSSHYWIISAFVEHLH